MRLNCILVCIITIALTAAIGCSGSSTRVTSPDESGGCTLIDSASRHTWGLWQFTADPNAGTLDVVRLRSGDFHLNALPFMEPPKLVNLTLESVEFNGNIIETDIGLRHPFIGLDEFTGFDVCGILITSGSVSGFDDTDLRMAGDGDMRLLNPDGYSRWWNPAEFPVNDGTIFSYQDGLLGAPDSHADYNSTLNAYKYYCDDLDADDPLSSVTLANRGMFSAGKKNIRHYSLDMGTVGLIFNYAVDASWKAPQDGPPWTVPDDFPNGANRPEAWRVEITEIENTLWNDGTESGGGLNLSIDVYDWYNAELNSVKVESPDSFDVVESSTATGGGAGYSTYEIEILDATPAEGSIDLLISVACEDTGYNDLLPGKTVTAYFTSTAEVSEESPEPEWKIPYLLDNSSRWPRATIGTNDDIVALWHHNGVGINYTVDDGTGWAVPDLAYGHTPYFMHLVEGDTNGIAYLGYKISDAVSSRRALRYTGAPGTWDHRAGIGNTGQPAAFIPDDDGSFIALYTFSGGFEIAQYSSWTSSGSPTGWADGSTIYMASTDFHERDGTNHYVGYYRRNISDIYSSRVMWIHKVWSGVPSNNRGHDTMFTGDVGEVVDSTASALDDGGRLHVVYRYYDGADYRIGYAYTDNPGESASWSSPVIIHDAGSDVILENYVGIDTDSTGRIFVAYAEGTLVHVIYSDNGVDWSAPTSPIEESDLMPGYHLTQSYPLVTADDVLHLMYIDKETTQEYGNLFEVTFEM